MSYFLRRLPLSRLLLLCGVLIGVGIGATALATALGVGPTPPPKPLAQAVHDTLIKAQGARIEGVSANIQLTNQLLEGASLAGGGGRGELTSSPLITGGSGRLWVAKDGRVRLELQSQQGDTQLVYDGHTVTLYDAATNTVYRYTPPQRENEGEGWSDSSGAGAGSGTHHEIPSVAKLEEAISRSSQHTVVSGATPTDVAGQPAYTVRVSPRESGSLLGGAELSWDPENGAPLRAAIYSSAASAPVIELAATEISFGEVESSVFAITPPANATVKEIVLSHGPREGSPERPSGGEKPNVTTHGHGLSTIAVLESKPKDAKRTGESLEGLPKVTIDGASASVLRTELGTLLTFERSGVRYLLAGAVSSAAVEEVAKGL